ncbi:acetyl-CoA C-acetyltransferase [Tamaricihabitans halophyticus]|uniref:Probable acetyl-CoA acetyltransferase n=1 Tax=Tamaricihabitans halophyticus TaxID=1262583 RepID=A0A4R2R1G2_9PSEU|nr:acetyl-CoA C-acyltransferase [Tamaricihabitans halophyticus]TCP55338.1 acetyl-CoA C-acetyltransferase [Tamaricihabitans halophyticus]
MTALTDRDPVLVAAARTPIGKLGGALARIDPLDLGAVAVAGALERSGGVQPDYVLLGNVVQAGNGQNPARLAASRAGVPSTVPAMTLNDVCLASMSAVAVAGMQLRAGEIDSAVVGGFDSMSQAPHAIRQRVAPRVGDGRLVDLLVHDGLWCGLADTGMGELSDAENERLGIARGEQDELAARSHRNARVATERGELAAEIVPVPGAELGTDEGIRGDTEPARLAKLRPAFTSSGSITAANASQMSDAAAAGVLTTAARARSAGHSTMTQIVDRTVVAGPDPTLHLKPAHAARLLLDRHGLRPADIDLWEINEAFAGVVLASVRELEIDPVVVNRRGGAIALGHPLGASGFRLVQTLAAQLVALDRELGVAAICGGGGQGQAMLLRRR